MRDDVLGIFGVCKDTEFLAMRQLLDELLPLVFCYYSTIRRGCRYSLWQNATLHLAIMFIVQQRHKYNKAMLAVNSDNIYRGAVIPEWKTTFSSYMNVFSEKKSRHFIRCWECSARRGHQQSRLFNSHRSSVRKVLMMNFHQIF